MSVICVGLNHRTVSLELLERMTVGAAELPKALLDLGGRDHLSEAVLLSTCNRTEVYAVAERFHPAMAEILEFMHRLAALPPDEVSDHLYTFHDSVAVSHLFSVASGIDSAVLGEGEILGQVKHAWEVAQREGTTGPHLNMAFRHAVETGKRARSETSIARHIASVSQAAVALAGERLGSLAGRRVLVLGAGETAEGMAVAVAGAAAGDVLVANRTWERAVEVAGRIGGRPVELSELAAALLDVDVLLCATGATSTMVDHADLEPVAAARTRPLLIVDVAVPRDVDPAASEIPGVTLLDMDDLRAFADAGLAKRRREVAGVRRIIDEEVVRFVEASTARLVAPLVADLRNRTEDLRRTELDRLGPRLGGEERAAVDAITRAVVAKLLHEPTVRLKDSAGTPRGERLADALRELFDL